MSWVEAATIRYRESAMDFEFQVPDPRQMLRSLSDRATSQVISGRCSKNAQPRALISLVAST
jgi:hypothetical protein